MNNNTDCFLSTECVGVTGQHSSEISGI